LILYFLLQGLIVIISANFTHFCETGDASDPTRFSLKEPQLILIKYFKNINGFRSWKFFLGSSFFGTVTKKHRRGFEGKPLPEKFSSPQSCPGVWEIFREPFRPKF